MRAPSPILLDFNGPPRRPRLAGILLFGAGVLACAALAFEFQSELTEREGLQARLSSLVRPHLSITPAAARNTATAAAIEKQLWIPWSLLLAELEIATHDVAATVSLLEVQPDPAKHIVHITAEARTLKDALAYLERLQKSPALRYPMLDSHELRKDDPEHPVRVKLSAEWRT